MAARKELPPDVENFKRRDYSITCGTLETTNWREAIEYASRMKNSLIIDVRDHGELPELRLSGVMQLPVAELQKHPEKVSSVEQLFLFCKTGVRSAKAAAFLKEIFPEKKIVSIEGGILDPSSPLNSSYHGAKA